MSLADFCLSPSQTSSQAHVVVLALPGMGSCIPGQSGLVQSQNPISCLFFFHFVMLNIHLLKNILCFLIAMVFWHLKNVANLLPFFSSSFLLVFHLLTLLPLSPALFIFLFFHISWFPKPSAIWPLLYSLTIQLLTLVLVHWAPTTLALFLNLNMLSLFLPWGLCIYSLCLSPFSISVGMMPSCHSV